MAYIEDVKRVFKLSCCAPFSIEMIENKYMVINGHKGICGYDKEEISLRIKCGILKIIGKELNLSALTESEAYVSGMIQGVYFEN